MLLDTIWSILAAKTELSFVSIVYPHLLLFKSYSTPLIALKASIGVSKAIDSSTALGSPSTTEVDNESTALDTIA